MTAPTRLAGRDRRAVRHRIDFAGRAVEEISEVAAGMGLTAEEPDDRPGWIRSRRRRRLPS